MMASSLLAKRQALWSVMIVLLFFTLVTMTKLEGRPLSSVVDQTTTAATTMGSGDVAVFDWLRLGGIKSSGPSGGGEGHRFTNSNTLGGIKNSGPSSPGQGH